VTAKVGDPWSEATLITYTVRQVPALMRFAQRRHDALRERLIAERRAKSMSQPLARDIVAILGADDLGHGYMIHDGAIETSHDWSLAHPDWRDRLSQKFILTGDVLGLWSSMTAIHPVSVGGLVESGTCTTSH
jgi:hypothetical protein